MKTKTPTEPLYPVGISARSRFDTKRGRIISRKWSNKSGWWYELRFPNSLTYSRPEADIVGMED